MRVAVAAAIGGLAVSMLGAAPMAGAGLAGGAATTPAAAAAAALEVTAQYNMNEGPGTSVMTDSSGNGNNGTVDPTGVQSGATFDNATGYNWVDRDPTNPPASPERVVRVADDPALEPGDGAFTMEIRFRTSHKYGNIIQKGQATTVGGQWKVQNPGGRPSCLFQGANAQVAARVPLGTTIDDNQWHVLACVFDQTGVELHLDGVRVARKNGVAGRIDNKSPMTIGGKLNCDQDTVTCDYFSGQVDYVKISKEGVANAKPTARFTSTCDELACTFDSSTSTDADGTITGRSWNFGDGDTSTAANPSHTFDDPGTYTVVLTVTDNGGATDNATHAVTVAAGNAPSRPRQVTASRADRAAVVAWKKPSSAGTFPVSGYVVTSAPSGRTCTTTGLTCKVTGLRNGVPYTFTVVARNDAGTGQVSKATTKVVPAGKPKAPSVRVRAGNHKVVVRWTGVGGNGSDITAYKIKRSGAKAKLVRPNARTFVFKHLKNGKRYRFLVAAVNDVGTGKGTLSRWVRPHK